MMGNYRNGLKKVKKVMELLVMIQIRLWGFISLQGRGGYSQLMTLSQKLEALITTHFCYISYCTKNKHMKGDKIVWGLG